MKINVSSLLDTLPIMLKGLLGIFIVTGLIILVVYLLNKFTAPKTEGNIK